MDRILRDAGGSIVLRTYDTAGDLANVDGNNAPTVAVTDSAGATVAGFTGAAPSPVGVYTVSLPANMETLDVYSVLWTWGNGQSRRTQFELVGSFLFSIADLQAFDTTLANETTYPVDTVRGVRTEVEQLFEEVANVSFTLRGRRFYLDGNDLETLMLPDAWQVRSLVAASVSGAALTSGQLADVAVYPHGKLVRDGAVWTSSSAGRNVMALVEFGYLSPPPRVRRAGMQYARHLLVKRLLETNDRATAVFTEGGEGYRLTIAGRDGPTGLPDVDSVLAQFGHRRPGIG